MINILPSFVRIEGDFDQVLPEPSLLIKIALFYGEGSIRHTKFTFNLPNAKCLK
jgi:hypothetical protein